MATETLAHPDAAHVAPFPPTDESDLITVLHGYGRVVQGEKHWIDNVLFTNGVARNVQYKIAKKWTQDAPGTKIFMLPNDADEADFARVTGVRLMSPQDVATMLTASDLDAVFRALGEDRALDIVRGLGSRLGNQYGGGDTTAPPSAASRKK